jgi:arsenite methyltransferase
MDSKSADEIRAAVRHNYAEIARGTGPKCCGGAPCCSTEGQTTAESGSKRLGYTDEDLQAVPEGADMGLGCGNPQAIAALQPGETVLDLGSGGGFDCFLAARQVGDSGRVIGVDMTPEMIAQARANAGKAGFGNVEFRLGEIEHVPVADSTVDAIISNCVINLSPDKAAVYQEAYRVLRPGGRLAISDVVATAPFPEKLQADVELWCGCIAGALTAEALQALLEGAGFKQIAITPKPESHRFIRDWAPGTDLEHYVVSASIQAVKPAQ